jgi:hypothetical protein
LFWLIFSPIVEVPKRKGIIHEIQSFMRVDAPIIQSFYHLDRFQNQTRVIVSKIEELFAAEFNVVNFCEITVVWCPFPETLKIQRMAESRITIPSGLKLSDSIIFPSARAPIARVVPHAGHG